MMKTDQSDDSVWPPQFIYRNTLNTMQKKYSKNYKRKRLKTHTLSHTLLYTEHAVHNNIHHSRKSWVHVKELIIDHWLLILQSVNIVDEKQRGLFDLWPLDFILQTEIKKKYFFKISRNENMFVCLLVCWIFYLQY